LLFLRFFAFTVDLGGCIEVWKD